MDQQHQDRTPGHTGPMSPKPDHGEQSYKGSGRLLGPFLGAAVAVVLPEGLRFAQNYYLFGYALAVILLMAFYPAGLIGLGERLVTMLTKPSAVPAKASP